MGTNCDVATAAELLKVTKKYRDLENEVNRFFELLERTEVTDSGKEWNPITITCCRALWGVELSECLHKLKDLTGGNDDSNRT